MLPGTGQSHMQNTTEWLKQPEIAKQTAKALDMTLRDFLKFLQDEAIQEKERAIQNAIQMRPVYRRMIEDGIDIKYLVEDDPLLLQTYLSEKRKWENTNLSKDCHSQKKSQVSQASI